MPVLQRCIFHSQAKHTQFFCAVATAAAEISQPSCVHMFHILCWHRTMRICELLRRVRVSSQLPRGQPPPCCFPCFRWLLVIVGGCGESDDEGDDSMMIVTIEGVRGQRAILEGARSLNRWHVGNRNNAPSRGMVAQTPWRYENDRRRKFTATVGPKS